MAEVQEEILKKTFPFWEKLKADEKEKLISGARKKTYTGGELVHSVSEKCLGLILVEKGVLRVFVSSEEGRDITLYRLEAGDACTLSASCFMSEITFEVMIDAQEDSEVILLNPAVFNQTASENIYVENYMYKQTAARFFSPCPSC